ncbi:tyrosine-type recombinase/integrase [Microgenomates group bacterium]|nr:tyrosine-type recombinase/integrase [Microgenomates group bacterium]
MSNLTLTQLKDRYEASLRQANKANATVIAYVKDIDQVIEYLSTINKSTPELVITQDIENFKQKLEKERYTAKSISRKVNSIKSFFKFLTTLNSDLDNPAKDVSQPKYEQQPPMVLSKNEYRALRDVCRGDTRMTAIVEMLLQTGMRISELANLALGDINLDKNIISINTQDTGIDRNVPLNEAAKRALSEYLKIRPRAHIDTVFLTKTCKPFLIRNIRNSIDRYFRLAGLKNVKVNDLRHTFIVEQLRAGVPLIYVSQLVGHKRITTTEKYLQFLDKDNSVVDIKIETL